MSSLRLALRRHGPDEGLPLVLLHAFPLDSRLWDDVITHLPDVPVVTLDAPGFGSSPLPDGGEPSLDTYADAVVETLADAGIERAVVAGLSMGGYTTLALIERHRDFLAGVGLLDTKANADTDEAREGRLAVAAKAEQVGAEAVAGMPSALLSPVTLEGRPEVVARLRGWLAEAPPAGIAWAQRAMTARPDRLGSLLGLGLPALVLRGEQDTLSPQSATDAMAEQLSAAAAHVIIPDAGHLTAIEAPEQVAGALAELHSRAI